MGGAELTSNRPLNWWGMIIEEDTGGREKSSLLKASVLSQLELHVWNINTYPSLFAPKHRAMDWQVFSLYTKHKHSGDDFVINVLSFRTSIFTMIYDLFLPINTTFATAKIYSFCQQIFIEHLQKMPTSFPSSGSLHLVQTAVWQVLCWWDIGYCEAV